MKLNFITMKIGLIDKSFNNLLTINHLKHKEPRMLMARSIKGKEKDKRKYKYKGREKNQGIKHYRDKDNYKDKEKVLNKDR